MCYAGYIRQLQTGSVEGRGAGQEEAGGRGKSQGVKKRKPGRGRAHPQGKDINSMKAVEGKPRTDQMALE